MKIKILLPVILLLGTSSAMATDINSLAAEIALQNPELAAARARYEAELQDASAQNVLPGPELDFDYKFGRHENRWGGSLTQSFDWPGVYSARRRGNRARQSAFEYLYKSEFLDRALAAKQLLLTRVRAYRRLNVLSEAQTNISRLQELYAYAFERGETTVLEVQKLKLQAFNLSNSYAEAEAELRSVEASIMALSGHKELNLQSCTTFPIQGLGSEEYYMAELIRNDPTVAATDDLVLAAEADISMARRSGLPSFKLGYAYENEGGESFHGFTLGLSLPAWTTRAQVAASRAQRLAAELGARDYELRKKAEIRADYATATLLEARVEAGKSTFESAEYPRLLRKALDAGRLNLFEYLREYNEFLEAYAEYVDIQYKYALAVTRLNRYELLLQ